MITNDVEARIAGAIADAEVTASGDSHRIDVTVVSASFEAVPRVRRQQMVYAAIADLIRDGALHAVTIRAQTPAERAGAR